MTVFEEKHPYLTAAAGGLAAGLLFTSGFAPLSWSWAAAAAVAGWFFLVSRLTSVRAAALSGLCFGLGWFVPGLAWTMNSMAVHGRLPWAVAFAGLVLLGAVLSLFPTAAAAAAKRLAPTGCVRLMLSLAGMMTLAEWLRTDVIVGFGWLAPAYAFLDTPFAGWAPILGADGVTLALMLSAALAVTAAQCRLRWLAVPVIAVALIVGTGKWAADHRWSAPSETVDIRVLQPNLPVVNAFVRASPAQRIESMLPAASEPWPADTGRAKLLLTPEGIVSVPVDRLSLEAAGALFALQEKSDAMVLFNGFRREKRHYYNSSFVIDEGHVAYRLDKRELVPFGEYVPAGARWFVDLLGIPLADLTPGAPVQPLLPLGNASAGILICYENLYGSVVRRFWQSGSPDFLIVTSNLGWFSDQILPQHLDMSRMRAMECARPLVSVSNSGLSAVVNSSGRVVKSLGVGETGSMTLGLMGAQGEATPFVRFGGAPALLLALLAAFNMLLSPAGLRMLKEISGKRL